MATAPAGTAAVSLGGRSPSLVPEPMELAGDARTVLTVGCPVGILPPAVDPSVVRRRMPKWRNRQTRYVQGVVPVRAWEFKSPLRHQRSPASPWRGLHFDKGRPRQDAAATTGPRHRDAGVGRRMVAGPHGGPEESPSCAERGARRKPGRRAAARRQSRSARRLVRRESNRDQDRPVCPGGVKRAILPAAISESADKDGCSPRPEVESSHGGDDVTGPAGPREMTITNRTRLTLSLPSAACLAAIWCL